MPTEQAGPHDIDAYIAACPPDVREILQGIRRTIQKAAPHAVEAISYRIPTFRLDKNLIHFAAFKNHVGVYPAPRSHERFREELSAYQGGKGTVRFPLDQPIPHDLIRRIVEFRVEEAKAGAPKRPRARG